MIGLEVAPGVRIRIWRGPREGAEGVVIRFLSPTSAAVRLENGRVIAESRGRLETLIA